MSCSILRTVKKLISPSARLLPGTNLTIAILMGKKVLTDETCPMPLCRSVRTSIAPGGGRLW